MTRRALFLLLTLAAGCPGGGGGGGYGTKTWKVAFAMPNGWQHDSTMFDTPTLLQVKIIDPAFHAEGDRVMDDKSEVVIKISNIAPGSPKAKAIAAKTTIAGIAADPSLVQVSEVMAKHRPSWAPASAGAIPMMRGPSEVHFGTLNMTLDRAVGFDGDTWIEIEARSEQGNAAAAASAKAGLDTVLATFSVKKL